MPLSFFKNLKVDEWDRMVDVNIKGVLYCTGAVINHMKEKKSGHIVNLSSVAGRVVFPAGSVYCATKFAVAAFTEGLRQEFSVRSNIRVTSIEPGIVATELTDTITDESLKQFVENGKKMETLQAQDIANAILYAVDSPSHVNVNEVLIEYNTRKIVLSKIPHVVILGGGFGGLSAANEIRNLTLEILLKSILQL